MSFSQSYLLKISVFDTLKTSKILIQNKHPFHKFSLTLNFSMVTTVTHKTVSEGGPNLMEPDPSL